MRAGIMAVKQVLILRASYLYLLSGSLEPRLTICGISIRLRAANTICEVDIVG